MKLILSCLLTAALLVNTIPSTAHAASDSTASVPDSTVPVPATTTMATPASTDPMALPSTGGPIFSGCTKSGKVCFAPSVALSVAAINLSTGKVEAAFSPGLGYGFIVNPGKFSSLGADVHFVMDPGAQNASLSLLGSFFNGFFHVGVGKGFVGDKSWRLLAGPSFTVPL